MLVPALAGVINVFASSPIFVVSTRLRAAQPGQYRDTCPPYLPISPYISPIFPYTSPGARPVPRRDGLPTRDPGGGRGVAVERPRARKPNPNPNPNPNPDPNPTV